MRLFSSHSTEPCLPQLFVLGKPEHMHLGSKFVVAATPRHTALHWHGNVNAEALREYNKANKALEIPRRSSNRNGQPQQQKRKPSRKTLYAAHVNPRERQEIMVNIFFT
ncbi:unnamed protein product [Ixodes pacificus]